MFANNKWNCFFKKKKKQFSNTILKPNVKLKKHE